MMVTHFRCIGPVGWTLIGLLLLADPAWSQNERKPAVSAINGSITGFYSGNYRSGWDLFDVDTEWNNTGGVAGEAFLPVGPWLGLSVSGGGRWGGADDWTSSPAVQTTSSELSTFFVGADLFWRNPETGYVGLFYDYQRDRVDYEGLFRFPIFPFSPYFPYTAVDQSDLNDLALAGGFYLGEIDIALDGGYERSCYSFSFAGRTSYDFCANGYEFGAGVAGYPGASDRVRVGLGLRGGQIAAGEEVGGLGGVAFVNWQPPFFGNRSVRLGGSFGAGAYFASGDAQPFVTLGLSLSVDLPGADNLKQLFREMRI